MKDRLKYVIDSRYFDGTCLTSMSDGFRNDYGGETIEELRIRENNPFLITVTQSRINKMLRIFYNSLEAPFREITEEDYFYLMDVLPPLYLKEDSFFVGEPHYVNIYPFCFERNGHYFQGLRSIKTPPNELDRQIDQYMKIMNRKATVIKTNPIDSVTDKANSLKLIPYYFSLDGKQPVFICNLVIQSDSRQARTDMANTLKSLRRNHYQFYKGKGHYETPDKLIDHVSRKKLTLVSDGDFFQYPPGRESATFIGHIKETSEEFLFRIYDREYFLYLLKRLRTVKKGKYSINSLVYWVTYVHNVVYSFYRSMIYCYINSTQRCAGSIVIDIIPTNGADKRKFFPFAPYFPVTNVIKRYFYPYFPAIIGIKGYSFPYFPYLSGIMKIKTALYSLFSRLDWHKTVVFPCLGEIYEGIRSLSWEIPVT